MTKPFEFFHGVEAEKAEAMRRYNNRRTFRNILRATVVASICYLWLPTVAISLQSIGDWLYRTGTVIITDRSVVFVFSTILVALIFLLSIDRDGNERSSVSDKPDLYNQYTSSSSAVTVSGEKVEGDDGSSTQIVSIDRDEDERSSVSDEPNRYDQHTSSSSSSSSAVTVTGASDEKVEGDDDSGKQIVASFIAEADREMVTTDLKGIYRTKSETKKVITRPVMKLQRSESETRKEIIRPATDFRRSQSAKEMERLSNEEFNLEIERYIMKTKRTLAEENDVVECQGLVCAVVS